MSAYDAKQFSHEHQPDPLTPEQRQWASFFKKTNTVPEMRNSEREPLFLSQAGYLHFRKIDAGGDASDFRWT